MAEIRPDRTLGPGHDDFWAHCEQEELHLPQCDQCGTYAWPIAPTCERCGGQAFTWRQLSGRATLISWCTFVQDYYKGAMTVPYTTILVRLEEGPVFFSNMADTAFADFRLDLPLTVTFKDCEDKAGPFKLPVFEAV